MTINDMIRIALDLRDELAQSPSHSDAEGATLAQALADHLWQRSRGAAPAATQPAASAQPAATTTPPTAAAQPDNPFAGM